MEKISFLYKSVSGLIITILFVASLFINVTMFTWSDGAKAMSAAFSAMTGTPSVITRYENSRKAAGDITKRIATRTARGATRNIASIPAESLPLVGIFVVLGITTLEIKDACDTMKDIEELNKQFSNELEVDDNVNSVSVCGQEVPTFKQIIASIKNSPVKIYLKLKTKEKSLPSWSDALNKIKNAWDNSILGMWNFLKWLFGKKS